jgi:hypothetical protein
MLSFVIYIVMLNVIILSVVRLSVAFYHYNAECNYAQGRYAECSSEFKYEHSFRIFEGHSKFILFLGPILLNFIRL